MITKHFKLTEAHLKLLSKANVGWDDAEFGAPRIDPKRPYGNSDVISDIAIAEIATIPGKNPYDLHRETETALQIVLTLRSFEPGDYVLDEDQWRRNDILTDEEYMKHFHSLVNTGIACGLDHPIEWVVNYERSGHHKIIDQPKINEVSRRALCGFFDMEHLRKPKDKQEVDDWIDRHYHKRGREC